MPTVFPRKLLPIGVERVVMQDKFTGLGDCITTVLEMSEERFVAMRAKFAKTALGRHG